MDLFVNATSIGPYPDVEAMPDVDLGAAAPGTLVCDVIQPSGNAFASGGATARILPTLDGLSMLVYEGVVAFQMSTGREPDDRVMKAAPVRSPGCVSVQKMQRRKKLGPGWVRFAL